MKEKPVHLCQGIRDDGRPCHRTDTKLCRIPRGYHEKFVGWSYEFRVWVCQVHRGEGEE
jgi:hypothetical protein